MHIDTAVKQITRCPCVSRGQTVVKLKAFLSLRIGSPSNIFETGRRIPSLWVTFLIMTKHVPLVHSVSNNCHEVTTINRLMQKRHPLVTFKLQKSCKWLCSKKMLPISTSSYRYLNLNVALLEVV